MLNERNIVVNVFYQKEIENDIEIKIKSIIEAIIEMIAP